jgi:cation diffusion facilitator family transporter
MAEHADHADHDTSHIIQSLAVNVVIAIGKGICAFLTGSGALLAETLHSFADCGNQVLLLVGVRRGQLPPDEAHPLGYGRAVYFWSFMVALLLFSGGGVFSIYEGIHKSLEHAHEESAGSGLWWGIGMLAFSLVLEGYSAGSNVVELNKRRGAVPFFKYLVDTKDSDLIVIFGENSAAVVGLFIALGSLILAHVTGDPRWDSAGTVLIGLVLVCVAMFLARETVSLLLGEAADPEIAGAVHAVAAEMPAVRKVFRVIAVQQGPGQVLIAMKMMFDPTLTIVQASGVINDFESRLRKRRPERLWLFIEPDSDGETDNIVADAAVGQAS